MIQGKAIREGRPPVAEPITADAVSVRVRVVVAGCGVSPTPQGCPA
jgi:hypothetical protein